MAALIESLQLWLYTRRGELKGDEHLCLSGAAVLHTRGQWQTQLRECGGYENEKWDYNSHVRSFLVEMA